MTDNIIERLRDFEGNAQLDKDAADLIELLLSALERILSYDDMVEGADEARAAIAKARGQE